MTTRELAAYHAGLRQAAEHALITAIALEIRPDGADLRQRAAIQALRGFAEGLRAEATPPSPADGLPATMTAIAADPARSGTTTCPECSGRLAWNKDDSNGHIHARCEDAGCITVMQ